MFVSITVTLTADYTGNICTNTIAVFTCISSTNVLFWVSGSNNHLFRATINSPNDTSIVGDFKVKLISKSGGKIISTATINATTNGISITCKDALVSWNSASKTIELACKFVQILNIHPFISFVHHSSTWHGCPSIAYFIYPSIHSFICPWIYKALFSLFSCSK